MTGKHPRVMTQAFVVVAALIEKDGKFLLIKENAPSHPDHGKWNLPGGWLEVGENPIEAVKREVKEESGYKFMPSSILGVHSIVKKNLTKHFNATPHAVKIVFLGKVSEKQGKFIESEISETKWFSADEIKKMDKKTLRDQDIKQMTSKYMDRSSYPLKMINHSIVK